MSPLHKKYLMKHLGFCSEFESKWESIWNIEKVKKLTQSGSVIDWPAISFYLK